MQQGLLLRVAVSAAAIVLAALALCVGSAAGATGGVTAPSTGTGGTYTGSTGGTTTGTRPPTGATTPAVNTGGISPNAVRTPSAPVKPRKKKRKKKRRRRPAQQAPAPTRTPAPAPAPAPDPPAATGDIPGSYLALYKAAAKAKGIDWRILAAIGKNESDHGRSTARGVHSGLNFADCCAGPMQMCTVKSCGKVWQYYAVDANGDGVKSVYDPADAIYAAAALVRDLKAIVGDDTKLLLAAYNAGPGNVDRYDGVPPFPETRAYVRAGLAYIASLR